MMINSIKLLIKEGSHCVLATVNGNQPYCSLMTYITDENVQCIYMVTHRSSRKFSYIRKNPRISLLIDTRDRKQKQAMTIIGKCKELGRPETDRIRERFIQTHSHMKTFVKDSEAEVICINIESVLLLNGLTDAHFVEF